MKHATWSGEANSRGRLEAVFARIEADRFGCFWRLDREGALSAAAGAACDGLLAGVPVGVKDAFDVACLPTTGGIANVERRAHTDAVAVRLLRRAGAVVVGKTAMDQLGWGMSGRSPGFPPCLNPRAPDRVPGGSSSGSAAAVAAGLVPLALGADTAGSVRIPAAWCGVVGFVPSPGMIPLAGCLPLVPALDRAGLFTANVPDCRLALEALRVPVGRPNEKSTRRPRVGVLEASFDCEPRIERACRAALRAWSASGAEVGTVDLGWGGEGLGKVYAFELAKRWGSAADTNPEVFGEDVLAGIAFGRTVRPDAYQAVLDGLTAREQEARRRAAPFDVIVCPTAPIGAPPVGSPDPVASASRNARALNALGFAAMSLPLPVADGLPVGLQLAAPRGSDRILIDAARDLEELFS